MTHAQLNRIDKLPEECRVIGQEGLGNPVIVYPSGKMQVVDHTGRLRAASMRVRMEIGKKQESHAERKARVLSEVDQVQADWKVWSEQPVDSVA